MAAFCTGLPGLALTPGRVVVPRPSVDLDRPRPLSRIPKFHGLRAASKLEGLGQRRFQHSSQQRFVRSCGFEHASVVRAMAVGPDGVDDEALQAMEGKKCTPGIRVLLIGPPGCGKGTQAENLARKYGLIHVHPGTLLKENIERASTLGKTAEPYVQRGELVPDDIVIQMVQKRLAEADCKRNGWVLDSFPATLKQAENLEADVCIVFNMGDDKVMERVLGRRYDPLTGRVYHKVFNKPEFEEVSLRLVSHTDDTPEKTATKLAAYRATSAEVLQALKDKVVVAGQVVEVEADRPIEEVLTQVERVILEVTPEGISAPCPQAFPKSDIFLIKSNGFICEREQVDDAKIQFKAPATEQVHLTWKGRPRNVLVLKKRGPELAPILDEVAKYLEEEENLNVFVEPAVARELSHLTPYAQSQEKELDGMIDFVVCLGGDGLILHVSQLFKNAVPPVLSFALGSLGFLTMFDIKDYKERIRQVIEGDFGLSLRMRLFCQLYRDGQPVPGKTFSALNEVVIDRGSSPFLCNLLTFVDGQFVTTVQADGLILATPTGSTAYSMSAGGAMLHPSVPAILFTPLCPHSLSFRPAVFPDSAVIEIRVPEGSRALAWASFDGKQRTKLNRGESIVVRMYEYPIPTVNKTDNTSDWFDSLARCLNWNERVGQKPLSGIANAGPPQPSIKPGGLPAAAAAEK